jgi:[ribosomal protein S5]-alanine N-acetyltransferase
VTPPEEFRTERLVLRRPRLEDADAVFANYAQDPEVTRYLTWPPHTDVSQTRFFMENRLRAWESGEAYEWVFTQSGDDTAIGMMAVRLEGHKANLGYVLARAYWGRGIVTEAVQPIVDWLMDQPEIFRVWAVCDVNNPASARVMEKVGMVYEGTLKRWTFRPGQSVPSDCLCYAKTK